MKLKLTPNIIWPIVVLIIALGAFVTKPWEQTTKETISVSSMGTTQVTPNIAKISATIENQNDNIDLARTQNEERVSNLVNALKDLGIEDKDIKTQYISGGPGYEPAIAPDSTQSISYPQPDRPNTNQVSTTLEVTIRNFDNSDEVLAALTQNGATNLYGPNLTVADENLETAKSQARENAVENARKKAEELAKLSNRKLGKAIKIQEQGDFGYPVPLAIGGSELDLKRQAAQIQPGQNEVTINLLVDFELK